MDLLCSLVGGMIFICEVSFGEDYQYALTGGPWLIFYHYLAIRQWEPRFKPRNTNIDKICRTMEWRWRITRTL